MLDAVVADGIPDIGEQRAAIDFQVQWVEEQVFEVAFQIVYRSIRVVRLPRHFGEGCDQTAAVGEAGDFLLNIGAGVDVAEADEVVGLQGAATGEMRGDAGLAEGYAERTGGCQYVGQLG